MDPRLNEGLLLLYSQVSTHRISCSHVEFRQMKAEIDAEVQTVGRSVKSRQKTGFAPPKKAGVAFDSLLENALVVICGELCHPGDAEIA